MFEFIRKYRRYRQTVNALSAMDDRTLNDIGITRHDIKKISRGR